MLEEELGARLFDRTTRAVEPTEQGLRLFTRAPELLAHANDVRSAVSYGARQLNLVCGAAALDTFAANSLLRFRENHPDVHVDVRLLPMTAAAEQLLRRQADLLLFNASIAGELTNTKALHIETLIEEAAVMLCREGHPLLEMELSIDTLLSFDWVAAGYSRLVQDAIPPELRDILSRRRFPKYLVPDQKLCFDMVANSDVLTYAPESAARLLAKKSGLRWAPLPFPTQYALAAFTRADAPPPPLAAAFIEAILEVHAAPAAQAKT